MNTKCQILFLVFISFFSCKSKFIQKEVNYIPYYLKVYKADSLYIVKNYKESYNVLDNLFKEYDPIQMTNYYEVTKYYQLKIILNKKIELKEFCKLISKYRLIDITLKNDSVFNIYYKKTNFFLMKIIIT